MRNLILTLLGITLFASCAIEDACNAANDYPDCKYEDVLQHNLNTYLGVFVEDAREYGIDLNYILEGERSITFGGLSHGLAGGQAWGACQDGLVDVRINSSNYGTLQPTERLALIYHELAHDVFNLDHQGSNALDNIMAPIGANALNGMTGEKFIQLKDDLFRKLLSGDVEPYCGRDRIPIIYGDYNWVSNGWVVVGRDDNGLVQMRKYDDRPAQSMENAAVWLSANINRLKLSGSDVLYDVSSEGRERGFTWSRDIHQSNYFEVFVEPWSTVELSGTYTLSSKYDI